LGNGTNDVWPSPGGSGPREPFHLALVVGGVRIDAQVEPLAVELEELAPAEAVRAAASPPARGSRRIVVTPLARNWQVSTGEDVAPERRRRSGWVAIAGASVVAIALSLIGSSPDFAFANRLMPADPYDGSLPFVSHASSDYELDVVDGVFRMEARSAGSVPAYSALPFARATDAVDVSASVVSVSGPARFGVACWHVDGREGYALVASTAGGVSVRRLDRTNLNGAGTVLAVDPRAPAPGPDASLRLSCDGLGGVHVRVTAYVNGREAVSALDVRGFRGFLAAGFVFQGDAPSAAVRFDCPQARVTGSAPLAGAAVSC
jgi:hypothetical protein